MTLTTERLREIAERRSPSLRWGEAEQIAAELLANREAQPMAGSTVFGDKRAVTVHAETAEVWNSDGLQVQSLFTAPPASVVNPEFTGAAAVPDFKALAENLVENLVDCGGADEEAVEQYLAFAEKACRAAMLAQPVSQGCKLPEGWIACRERLPDTDGNYWGWWSASKRQGPVWFIKSDVQAQFQSSEITHWMPLPAAPATAPDEIEPDSIDKFVAQVCGDLTTSNRQ